MKRDLARLADNEWDVIVVGGGITGALVAWDATLRGLSVALVEKGDFGEATSAASSKLIHGGIRYLQQGQIGKVRESIVERKAFLRIAPHLVRPVPFLIPTFGRGMRGRAVLAAGMSAYEVVGADRNAGMPKRMRVEGFRMLGRSEALECEPHLPSEGLTGAVVFPEWHMDNSERMTLAFVAGAAGRGAACANRAEVVGFLGRDDCVEGVRVEDRLDGEQLHIRGRIVVNAGGPWAFGILGRGPAAGGDWGRRMAHSKGCHVVVDPVTNGHALALATRMENESLVNRGGRHIFLIPWRGRTLIGTTNVPHHGPPDAMEVTARDIDDFVEEIRSAIPAADITREQVQYAFGGLYPLVDTDVQETVYQGSGRYQILDHAETDGVAGIVTALGAKYTTARSAAEKCVDVVLRKLDRAAPCTTAITPVVGDSARDREDLFGEALREAPAGVAEDSIRELVVHHGPGWSRPLEAAADEPSLLEPVAESRSTLGAEVRWAAREEMAGTLADVIFRRTGLGTIGNPGSECLRKCAGILAAEHGWTAERTQQETAEIEATFERLN